jgi:hypothetical protein
LGERVEQHAVAGVEILCGDDADGLDDENNEKMLVSQSVAVGQGNESEHT